MKIIQITDHNGNGGVNSFVYDLCEEQVKLGNEVLFISIIDYKQRATSQNLEKIKRMGVHLKCIGATNKKDALLHYIGTLRSAIKSFAQDEFCICNVHLKLSTLMGVVSTIGLPNIKIVETYHNNYSWYHLQYAVLHPWIKQYIAISYTCGKEMKKRFHTKDHLMTVIPNGVSRNEIRSSALTQSSYKYKETNFVTVGRLSFEKNIKIPVQAFSRFNKEGWNYVVVGDGPQGKEIREVANNNPHVIFTGELPRQEALRYLVNADAVIMPSLWEGRSILQLEAMALDKPMILSNVPALREVFDEAPLADNERFRKCEWGYLVETNNEESYCRAAENFMALSKEEIAKMASRVRKASLENDIFVVAQKYQEVYEKIMRI